MVAGCGDAKKAKKTDSEPTPAATVAASGLLAVAQGLVETTATATATATPTPGPTSAPTPAPTPEGAPPPPKFAVKQAAKLPPAQQAAQVLLVGFDGTDLSSDVFTEIEGHGWGGISISPDNAPTGDLYSTFAGEAVLRARNAGRVPPFVLAQLDGGPEHLGSSPAAAREAASTSSTASQAVGITLAIEPRIDVGIGADPELIARVAPAAVSGWLHGDVVTAAAHFPGQGAATQDPLDGPAIVGLSPEELLERDLLPFKSALKVSPAVTISSATYSGYDAVTPASLTPAIVRDLLRDQLRFGGMAMTDDLAGAIAVTGRSFQRAAVAALKAGIDLVYIPAPEARAPVYRAILAAVKSKDLPRARLRDAVAHVLAAKKRAKLLTP
jgi:beta-N-acetylhexosaminidase